MGNRNTTQENMTQVTDKQIAEAKKRMCVKPVPVSKPRSIKRMTWITIKKLYGN